MLFEPDEQLDPVFAGEAAHHAAAVLLDAREEVRGHSGVEGAVALGRQNVDARLEIGVRGLTPDRLSRESGNLAIKSASGSWQAAAAAVPIALGSRFRGNDE
jgi:hypothetical protein